MTKGDRSGADRPAPSPTSIPPGTRDVLPEEMRELRAIGDRMRETFEGAGYGEIHTPALEYEEVLRLGDARAAGARYRTFDEQGDVLALRSDMTIPIARVVATRYEGAEPPLRFSYSSRAWRATDRGVGEPREFLQAGIELIGIPGRGGRRRGGGAHDRGPRRRRAAPAPRRGRRRVALPAAAAGARGAAPRRICRCSRRSRGATSSGSR